MNASLDEVKWLELSQVANEIQIADAFRNLSSIFSPILIKGWAISRFFDEGHFRLSTDIDLLIAPDKEEIASRAIMDLALHAAIDTHYGPRNLDLLTFHDLFDRSYTVELNGVPIRVLADEDNLRITAVHWLTDGGVNKDKLWDIYYLVKNRKPDFDWDRCLDANGPIRKTWVLAAIATARDHLGLDVSDLPEETQKFKLPKWYEQTLEKEWRLGAYPRRILSTVMFRPSLLLEQLRRKLPPNRIAATVDAEAAIDETSRIPVQIKSLSKKVTPFARGIGKRVAYSIRGSRK
jgi:hypothetical protein